jgi:putative MATE family efflux protein
MLNEEQLIMPNNQPLMDKNDDTVKEEQRLHKDWTQGPIVKNLLLLSWPMVVMESLYVVSQFWDMVWVGRISSSAVAGVGVGSIILLFVMSIDFGIIVGVKAMIARHVGSRDVSGAAGVSGQAFLLAVIWGTIMTVTGYFISEPSLRLFGVAPEVVSEGSRYLIFMFAGWIPLEILVMGLYVIQATGDTVRPMVVELLIRIFHLILCPLVVMGYWGFPRMGVQGAALANVASQILGAIMVMWLLFTGRTRIRLRPDNFRANFHTMMRILRIGIPALIMQFQRSFGTLALAWFIIPFGTVAIAAHSIIAKIDMALFMPSIGMGSGAGVLVGQNLGAHKPERAERGAWYAVGFVEVFCIIASVLLFLWAEEVMTIFTHEKTLIETGAVFLKIASVSYILLGPGAVLQSCIAGAGDTFPNMVISIGIIWAVQIPLAYILPKFTGLGVLGVRWAIVISTFVGAVGYTMYFSIGRWKQKRV